MKMLRQRGRGDYMPRNILVRTLSPASWRPVVVYLLEATTSKEPAPPFTPTMKNPTDDIVRCHDIANELSVAPAVCLGCRKAPRRLLTVSFKGFTGNTAHPGGRADLVDGSNRGRLLRTTITASFNNVQSSRTVFTLPRRSGQRFTI